MSVRSLLASLITLSIFYIGFVHARRAGITSQQSQNREDIYRGRNLIACSPDWSELNIDSLAQTMVPLPGTGLHHWNIHSSKDSAQFYFDQGINLYYGFHIIESMSSFAKAQEFDPENPMIHWGRALAYGPNINDVEYAATPEALEAARKAMTHSNRADSIEKALIGAMQARYSAIKSISRTSLNEAYAKAMKQVYDKYGASPEVSTLYADALMLLHPWKYWKKNGQPEEWTPEIIRVLEKTLAADPDHPGANHYYIHMVEASPEPAKALASADRLPLLMPGVSHMVHMPSHIYIRTGFYQKGINVNTQSVEAYKKYLNLYPEVINNAALYQIHNLHMKAACALMLSSYEFSASTAQELVMTIDTSFLSMAAPWGNYAQYLYMTPLMADIRFGKWKEILQAPVPPRKQQFSYALYLWGKGMAQAELELNMADAKKTLGQLREWMKKPDLQVVMAPFNKPVEQMRVGEWLLAGRIAEKENLLVQSEEAYKKAMAAEDNLIYNEPSDWLLPARYWMGMLLFRQQRYGEAEKIFLADLRINPRNYHSLSVLGEIYSIQQRYKEMEETNQMIKESAY